MTPDIAVTAPGHTLFRADRCPVLSQKEKEGGVCFLVNQRWCKDTKLVSQSCSVELETLIINCRSFYSPREFSSVVLVGVYIPPEVNAAKAINQLADQVLAVQNANPDSLVIVIGDFNHTCLSKALQRYKQHVDCPTCKDKILDHCYTVYKGAYHTSAHVPLGKSDHSTVILTPAYRQHIIILTPAYRQHTVILTPAYRQHTIILTPAYRQHIVILTPAYRQHAVILTPAYTQHTVILTPAYTQHTVILTPAYRQKLKTQPVKRTMQKWIPKSTEALRSCFECTDWSTFEHACTDLDKYIDTVTAYISFCVESRIPTWTVCVYTNDKPWFMKEVKNKLVAKDAAFRSGDGEEFRRAKYNTRRTIARAKMEYKDKLEDQFASNNTHAVWQGLQTITQYKAKSVTTSSD